MRGVDEILPLMRSHIFLHRHLTSKPAHRPQAQSISVATDRALHIIQQTKLERVTFLNEIELISFPST